MSSQPRNNSPTHQINARAKPPQKDLNIELRSGGGTGAKLVQIQGASGRIWEIDLATANLLVYGSGWKFCN